MLEDQSLFINNYNKYSPFLTVSQENIPFIKKAWKNFEENFKAGEIIHINILTSMFSYYNNFYNFYNEKEIEECFLFNNFHKKGNKIFISKGYVLILDACYDCCIKRHIIKFLYGDKILYLS